MTDPSSLVALACPGKDAAPERSRMSATSTRWFSLAHRCALATCVWVTLVPATHAREEADAPRVKLVLQLTVDGLRADLLWRPADRFGKHGESHCGGNGQKHHQPNSPRKNFTKIVADSMDRCPGRSVKRHRRDCDSKDSDRQLHHTKCPLQVGHRSFRVEERREESREAFDEE